MASNKHDRIRRALPVRSRQTMEPGRETYSAGTVHCPPRDASVPVKTCLLCPRCLALEATDEGRRVVCEYEVDATRRETPRRRRRPTDADCTPLSAIMSGDLVCVSPELPVAEVVALLIDRGFSGVPVVDSFGKPIGVLSKSDLLDGDREGVVGDLMMPIAFTLPENASLAHAAALMAYENVHRIPVVADDGTVVGIVSSMDIVRWVAEEDGYVVGRTRNEDP